MTAKEFLSKADELSVKKLSRDILKINEKGESIFVTSIQDSIGLNYDKSVKKVSALFRALNSFLQDAVELTGSYKDMCKKLPCQSEVNKIFKNIYRISRVIRNAEEHNERSMSHNGNIVEIKYSHCKRDFFLKVGKDAVCLLEKIIYEFVFLFDKGYSEKYQELLLGSLYELVEKHFYLSEFKDDDDIDGSLFDIKPCPKLNIVRRSCCCDLGYYISEKRLVFDVPANAIPNSVNVDEFLGVDIWVKINGKDYVFPSEILDKDYSISLDEYEEFAMEKYAGWKSKTNGGVTK